MTSSLPPALQQVRRTALKKDTVQLGARPVAEETAIAFVYDGVSEAVMMATPADLEDFAIGFSITEGIIGAPKDLRSLEIVSSGPGIEVRMALAEARGEEAWKRRRQRAGPVGCGLCGVESLAQAMRSLPRVVSDVTIKRDDVVRGMRLLGDAQSLNHETHAVHAAGFYAAGEGMIAVREDVGRHNALDKVAGALARAGRMARGAILLTSRISVELVQKAAMINAPVLAAISAPTALALRTADEAGITVIGIVRGEEMEIFTHPQRLER
jgi:FdhD protein